MFSKEDVAAFFTSGGVPMTADDLPADFRLSRDRPVENVAGVSEREPRYEIAGYEINTLYDKDDQIIAQFRRDLTPA